MATHCGSVHCNHSDSATPPATVVAATESATLSDSDSDVSDISSVVGAVTTTTPDELSTVTSWGIGGGAWRRGSEVIDGR